MKDFGVRTARDLIPDFECFPRQHPLLLSYTVTNVPKILTAKKCLLLHSLDGKDHVKSMFSPVEEYVLSRRNVIAHSSCNGLILIQIDDTLFAWNPVSKFFKKLLTYKDVDIKRGGYNSLAELCFDPFTEEYKVVLVNLSHSHSGIYECFYVATCGDTSTWEEIEVPYGYTIDNVHLGTLFKGTKYWICKGRLSQCYLEDDILRSNHIIRFDPHTNEIVEVPIPQPKKGDRDTIVGLGVLDGFLCMTRLDDSENCVRKIEFLAMKKHGFGDSWVTMFVISNIPKLNRYDIIEPLFMTKEGEVLASMYMSGTSQNCNIEPCVKSYDVNGNFLRDISVSTKNDHFKVILYEETWASPSVYDEEHTYDLAELELEDSFEEGFRSRTKKRNKEIETKNYRIKKKDRHSKREHRCLIQIEISRRKKERKRSKRNKRNYDSKCGDINFHLQHDLSFSEESNLEGTRFDLEARSYCLTSNGMKIKKRPSDISHKPCVIGELYTSMNCRSYFDIAEDLIIDILSRLPLKSLARFKCVSKQWKILILHTVSVRSNSKLLIISRLENKCRFHLLDQEFRVERICSPMEEHLLDSVASIHVHSSCNGLLLIEIDKNFVVWNPLTKFIKKVSSLYPYYDDYFRADLCFNDTNNEYKIVAVNEDRHPNSEWFMVARFGAPTWEGGDCTWEGVDVPFVVRNVCKGPSFKGYRHWFCKSHTLPSDKSILSTNHIMYFDPCTNALIEVPMPQCKNFDTHIIVGLGVLDECLCMTRYPAHYEGNIEFLKMKEYGNGNSWDIMFVISNVPKFNPKNDEVVPLFITKEGEVLVSIRSENNSKLTIKVYDYNGRVRRDIQAYSGFVLHEESWLSPDENLIKIKYFD